MPGPGSGITIIQYRRDCHDTVLSSRARGTKQSLICREVPRCVQAGRSATLHAPSRLGPRELEHYDLLSIEARDVDLVAVNMDCSDITF